MPKQIRGQLGGRLPGPVRKPRPGVKPVGVAADGTPDRPDIGSIGHPEPLVTGLPKRARC
jgi:hypothetical protein